jgi:ABC-type transport system involved in multi-copper enzyme maturation permease subunit
MFAAVDTAEGLTLGLLALAALVGVAVAAYVAFGLFQARSLVRREFAAYFVSPIAYAVLVVFLGVTGYLFVGTLNLLTATGPRGTEWPMQTMFADRYFWILFLFIPPILTMRLFAEERGSGTLEILLTAPLRDWQVVLAKYFACLAFYVVMWLPTLAYLPVLLGAERPIFRPAWTPYSVAFVGGLAAAALGLLLLVPRFGTALRLVSVVLIAGGAAASAAGGWLHYHRDAEHLLTVPVALDPYPVLTTYLGLFLAGAMFLALGLLVSSLVTNQLVAAILSAALGLVFILVGIWRPEQDGTPLYQRLYYFSVPLHFDRAFTRGLLDTRPLVLYTSVALFCLFLTVRSVESRRWQ